MRGWPLGRNADCDRVRVEARHRSRPRRHHERRVGAAKEHDSDCAAADRTFDPRAGPTRVATPNHRAGTDAHGASTRGRRVDSDFEGRIPETACGIDNRECAANVDDCRHGIELVPRGASTFAVLWHEPQAVTRVARQLRIDEMPRDAGGVRARRPGALQGHFRQQRRLPAVEDVEAFTR